MRFLGGKALFLALLLGLAAMLSGRAIAAPQFPDVPDMWASDAVRALAAKGLLEGYPDGTFKGDRAATRYEVAMIVARLLAREEQEHATFASKADLDAVRQLVGQLREELDALGVRVQHLEDSVANLDKRVTELERITFYGNFHSIAISEHFVGAPFISTLLNPAIDYSNGRLMYDGWGFTARTLLGAQIKLNEKMTAGVEFFSYYGTGSALIEQYWGVTPPYSSNPFLSQLSVQPGLQGDNHQPFNRMAFDRFWLQDHKNGYQLSIGTFDLKTVGDQVALGIRNPNINTPYVLPFWGTQICTLDPQETWQYEFLYSQLPNSSFYHTDLYGAASSYDFGPVKLGASLLNMTNAHENNGGQTPAGFVALPVANGVPETWLDRRTGSFYGVVGPQAELIGGINVDATFIPNKFWFHGVYGHSSYDPDKSRTFFNRVIPANMYSAGLEGKFGEISATIDYIHVDPTYDPMVLPYGTNTNIPTFLPYGNYYTNFYQLHDYLKYPDNRKGPSLKLAWTTNDTSIWFKGSTLQQINPTTFGQFTRPGNVEPLFPLIGTPGITARGYVNTAGLGGYHKWDCGLHVDGSIWDYRLRRGTVPADDVDFVQNLYRIRVGYPVAEHLDLSAHYTYFTYRGHGGFVPADFHENIPGLTLDYQMARNASVALNARLINFRNNLMTGADWHGDQVTLDVNVDI